MPTKVSRHITAAVDGSPKTRMAQSPVGVQSNSEADMSRSGQSAWLVGRLFGTARDLAERRRSLRHLQRLPEDLLDDVGLTREQVTQNFLLARPLSILRCRPSIPEARSNGSRANTKVHLK